MAKKKKTAQLPLVKYLFVASISFVIVVASIVLYYTTLKKSNDSSEQPSSVIGTVVLNKMYTGDEGESVASLKLSAVSNSGRVDEMKIWTGSVEPSDWISFQKTMIIEIDRATQIHVRYKDESGGESNVYTEYTNLPVEE